MAEKITSLTIKANTSEAERALKRLASLNVLAGMLKDSDEAKERMRSLGSEVAGLQASLSGLEEGSAEFKQITEAVKALNAELKILARKDKGLDLRIGRASDRLGVPSRDELPSVIQAAQAEAQTRVDRKVLGLADIDDKRAQLELMIDALSRLKAIGAAPLEIEVATANIEAATADLDKLIASKRKVEAPAPAQADPVEADRALLGLKRLDDRRELVDKLRQAFERLRSTSTNEVDLRVASESLRAAEESLASLERVAAVVPAAPETPDQAQADRALLGLTKFDERKAEVEQLRAALDRLRAAGASEIEIEVGTSRLERAQRALDELSKTTAPTASTPSAEPTARETLGLDKLDAQRERVKQLSDAFDELRRSGTASQDEIAFAQRTLTVETKKLNDALGVQATEAVDPLKTLGLDRVPEAKARLAELQAAKQRLAAEPTTDPDVLRAAEVAIQKQEQTIRSLIGDTQQLTDKQMLGVEAYDQQLDKLRQMREALEQLRKSGAGSEAIKIAERNVDAQQAKVTKLENPNSGSDPLNLEKLAEAKARLESVKAAYKALQESGEKATDKLRTGFRAVIEAQKQVQAITGETGGLLSRLGNLGRETFGNLFPTTAAAAGVGIALAIQRITTAAYESTISVDRLRQSLVAATGSPEEAAAGFERVAETSSRLANDLSTTTAAYSGFTAAVRGTILEGAAGDKVFSSFAGVLARMNVSTERSQRAFVALQQMLNKGVVSSEELKGQLGEVIPGVLARSARALNVTTLQLTKMLDQGQIMAVDLLPKLADELGRTFNVDAATRVNNLGSGIQRLKNEATLLAATTFEPLVAGLNSVANSLAEVAKGWREARKAREESADAPAEPQSPGDIAIDVAGAAVAAGIVVKLSVGIAQALLKIAAFRAALVAVGSVLMSLVTGPFAAVGAALTALLSPVGLTVAVVAAVVAGLGTLYSRLTSAADTTKARTQIDAFTRKLIALREKLNDPSTTAADITLTVSDSSDEAILKLRKLAELYAKDPPTLDRLTQDIQALRPVLTSLEATIESPLGPLLVAARKQAAELRNEYVTVQQGARDLTTTETTGSLLVDVLASTKDDSADMRAEFVSLPSAVDSMLSRAPKGSLLSGVLSRTALQAAEIKASMESLRRAAADLEFDKLLGEPERTPEQKFGKKISALYAKAGEGTGARQVTPAVVDQVAKETLGRTIAEVNADADAKASRKRIELAQDQAKATTDNLAVETEAVELAFRKQTISVEQYAARKRSILERSLDSEISVQQKIVEESPEDSRERNAAQARVEALAKSKPIKLASFDADIADKRKSLIEEQRREFEKASSEKRTITEADSAYTLATIETETQANDLAFRSREIDSQSYYERKQALLERTFVAEEAAQQRAVEATVEGSAERYAEEKKLAALIEAIPVRRKALQLEIDDDQFGDLKAKAEAAIDELARLWDTLSQSVQAGTMTTVEAQAKFGQALAEARPKIAALTEQLGQIDGPNADAANEAIQDITRSLSDLNENVRSPFQRLMQSWRDTGSALQDYGAATLDRFADALTNFVTTGKLGFKDFANAAIQELNRIAIKKALALALGGSSGGGGLIQTLGSFAGAFFGAPSAAGSNPGGFNVASGSGSIGAASGLSGYVPGPAGFAKGGLVRGPGSDTSDSIPAVLSNGEYVLRAAAVRRVGKALLDQLNTSAAPAREAVQEARTRAGLATAPAKRTNEDIAREAAADRVETVVERRVSQVSASAPVSKPAPREAQPRSLLGRVRDRIVRLFAGRDTPKPSPVQSTSLAQQPREAVALKRLSAAAAVPLPTLATALSASRALAGGEKGAGLGSALVSRLSRATEPLRFAVGGYVSGPGTSTSDSIPARLSNGEYVINAAAVSRIGVDVLDRLNGAISAPNIERKFARGGLVGPRKAQGGTAPIQINQTIDARGSQDPAALLRAGAAIKAETIATVNDLARRGMLG